MNWCLLALLLVLSSCGTKTTHPPDVPSPEGYDEVGNGGDYLRILVEQGRQYGYEILERIKREAAPDYLERVLEPGELDWIFNHREDIAEHLKKVRYRWVHRLPAGCTDDGACGCNLTGDTVFLSQDRCEATVQTRTQAAQLLTHETLHRFFGSDETKVKRLGSAIASIWTKMGHPNMPHWKKLVPLGGGPRRSAWTGKELMTWGTRERFVHYYDPRQDSWREENSLSAPADAQPAFAGGQFFGGSAIWSGKNLVFFSCGPQKNSLLGLVYDPANRRWRKLSSTNEPTLCENTRAFLIGEDRVLYVAESEGALAQVAIYDVAADRWLPVEVPNELSARGPKEISVFRFSSVWTGKELILWGGMGGEYGWDQQNKGFLFDPAANVWTPLPGAIAKCDHAAVWTGTEMIVYGGIIGPGHRSSLKFDVSAAAFTPSSRHWRELPNGNLESWYQADDGRNRARPLATFWTGLLAGFASEDRLAFYNPYLNRWTEPTETAYFIPPWDRVEQYENLSLERAESRLEFHWTGTELILWNEALSAGLAFLPE